MIKNRWLKFFIVVFLFVGLDRLALLLDSYDSVFKTIGHAIIFITAGVVVCFLYGDELY